MTPAIALNSFLPSLAFIDGVGGPEMLLILVIVLLLFGGDKLPEFARGMGKTMRELKKAASGVEDEFRRAMEEDERKKAAAAYEASLPPPAAGSEPGAAPAPVEGKPVEAGPAAPGAETATGTAPAEGAAGSAPTPPPAKRVIASEDCP